MARKRNGPPKRVVETKPPEPSAEEVERLAATAAPRLTPQTVPQDHAAVVSDLEAAARARREEQRRLFDRVGELLQAGATDAQMHRALATPDPKTGIVEFPNLTRGRVARVQALVAQAIARRMLEAESPDGVRARRSAAVQRAHELRRWAMTATDSKGNPRVSALFVALGAEKLIAQLEGTLAPKKVDLSVEATVAARVAGVLASMDDESADALLEEARADRELADAARRAKLIPAVIDVPAEVDPSTRTGAGP